MTDPNPDPVRDAQVALDAYEQRAVSLQTITYRDSPMLADILIRALLRDLAAYADQHDIGIDTGALNELSKARLQAASPRPYPVGAEVQVRADASTQAPIAALRGRRGFVTDQHASDTAGPECTVRFPGVPAGQFRLAPTALDPARPFPRTVTRSAVITSAVDAEKALINAAARVLRDRQDGVESTRADVLDRTQLAEALAIWTKTTPKRVLFCLAPQVGQAARDLGSQPAGAPPTPAQLAAADFPRSISDGVPSPGREVSRSGVESGPRNRPRPTNPS